MSERWEWVEIIEPRTQEHMYANLTTGECVWEPPPGVRIKKTDDNQWWELFDQNTSRYYYYNATSQKTVWHRPHNCDIIPLAKLQTLKQNTEVDDDGDAFKPVARREMSTQTPTTPKRSEYRIITPRTASVRSSSSMTTQTSPHPGKKSSHAKSQHHHRQGSGRTSRDDRSLPSPHSTPQSSNSARLPRRRGSIPSSGSFTSPTEDPVVTQVTQAQVEPRKSLDSPKPRRSRDRDSSRGSMDSAGSHYSSHGRSASYDSSGPRSMDSSYTRESPVLKAPTPDYRTLDNAISNRYYDSGTYSRDSGSQSQSRSSLESNPKVYSEVSVGTHQHGYESSHSRSSYDSSPHGLLDPPQQQQQQQTEPVYSSAESDSTTGRPKRSFPRTNPSFNSASRRTKRDDPQYYDRYEIQELLNNSGIQEDELSDYQPSRLNDSARQSDSDSSFRMRDRSHGSRDRSDGSGRESSRDWSEGRSEGSQGSRTIRDLSDTHSQSSQGSRNLDFHHSAQSLNSQRSNQDTGTPNRDSRESPRVVYAQPQRSVEPRLEPRMEYPVFPMSSIGPPTDDSHIYQELEETRRNVASMRGTPEIREATTVAVPMTPTHVAVVPGRLDPSYGSESPQFIVDSGSEGAHRNFSSSLYTHLNWPGYGDDNQDDSDTSSVFSSPSPQPRHSNTPPSLDIHHAQLRSSMREKGEAGTPILEKSLSLQAELAHHRPISMVVASHSEANMMSAGTNSLHRLSYRHISVPTTRSSNSLSRSRRPGSDTEIEQYAEKNLNTHKKGFFGKKMSLSLMLSWSKDPISKPMLRTELKSVKKEALETFKLIQQYMGDRKTKMTPPEVALQLTTKGWQMKEIRDEMYIQMCRQTTDNMWDESLLRGWELIAICLAFFPPTQKFHTYLEGYICRHLDPACDTETGHLFPPTAIECLQNVVVPVSHFAAYCHKKLERITKMGPKRGVRKPTPDEVEAARRCIFQPSMFGATLEEVMLLQRQRFPDLRLPWIQTTLSEEVLRLGGARVEGIFRVPGDIDEVNALKVRVDQFMTPDMCPDPHVPASLLKLWLRELYEPIIPEDVYQQCVDNYANPEAAIDIVMGLPEINKLVLCYLIRFLQVFAALENAAVTKMDINNLAMVMAPNCLRCESEDPKVIFENTRKEMAFMRTLVQSLDTSFMEGVR